MPPSPPGGGGACLPAHGARVGAMGPGGNRDASGRVAADGDIAAPAPLAVTHGAVVDLIGGAVSVPAPAVAQGALVPNSTLGRAVGTALLPESGTTGRPCGPEVECTVVGGGIALGSRSKLNNDPKGKCWTTGNFDRTSALYIFTMPWKMVSSAQNKAKQVNGFTYLIDFTPTSLNPRYVIEHRAMFPERALLDIVNEPDGRKI